MRIAAVTIQRCHANSPKDVFIPGSKKEPYLFALLYQINAATPLWFCAVDATRQNLRIHPHWERWTKHATNWMHTWCVDVTEQNDNTNQDLVTGPRYIQNDSDSREGELHPELIYQLMTSTQTQNFNEERNFGHNSRIGVHSTNLVDNDVLRKRVLPVSYDQRSPHDSLTLSLNFYRTHGIPFLVQHFPVWRVQDQALVAWKMFAALEVS